MIAASISNTIKIFPMYFLSILQGQHSCGFSSTDQTKTITSPPTGANSHLLDYIHRFLWCFADPLRALFLLKFLLVSFSVLLVLCGLDPFLPRFPALLEAFFGLVVLWAMVQP